ncbi:MAG: VanZ family protein [Candidatus Aenigmarchaeota archaeon]|nr:VanZ family protein [Candidatus Aenigmarchaeota archaeon]
MKKVWTIIKLWLPVIVWCGVIFYFSNTPDLKSNLPVWLDFIFRKIAHMAEFMVLFYLLARAMCWKKKFLWLAVILSIFYACTDEYHQQFVLGRHCSIRDVLIDTLGILIGYELLIRYRQKFSFVKLFKKTREC